MATKQRKHSCKHGKLKRPVRTKKGGKRRCKKNRKSKNKKRKRKYRMDPNNYVYWPNGFILDLNNGNVEVYVKLPNKNEVETEITRTRFLLTDLKKSDRYKTFSSEFDANEYYRAKKREQERQIKLRQRQEQQLKYAEEMMRRAEEEERHKRAEEEEMMRQAEEEEMMRQAEEEEMMRRADTERIMIEQRLQETHQEQELRELDNYYKEIQRRERIIEYEKQLERQRLERQRLERQRQEQERQRQEQERQEKSRQAIRQNTIDIIIQNMNDLDSDYADLISSLSNEDNQHLQQIKILLQSVSNIDDNTLSQIENYLNDLLDRLDNIREERIKEKQIKGPIIQLIRSSYERFQIEFSNVPITEDDRKRLQFIADNINNLYNFDIPSLENMKNFFEYLFEYFTKTRIVRKPFPNVK